MSRSTASLHSRELDDITLPKENRMHSLDLMSPRQVCSEEDSEDCGMKLQTVDNEPDILLKRGYVLTEFPTFLSICFPLLKEYNRVTFPGDQAHSSQVTYLD